MPFDRESANQQLNSATEENFHEAYEETLGFLYHVAEKYEFYPDMLQALRDGETTVELRKRFMLKAIDETWVRVIEDSLTALDEIIRKPGRFIEENEEIMPIELSRHISSRSVRHLAQRSDLISEVDGDSVTPLKILNVFYDETMLTYENKFINTLIDRLYGFVSRRYSAAIERGKDEKTTTLEIKQTFAQEGINGKINVRMELSEEPKEGDSFKNYTYTTDLWQRVVKLNSICRAYVNSEFAKSMGKNFIRPPVLRTNPILKNRNLRQCLALWEFIESYESTGFEMMVHEDLETLDARYVEELYRNAALQYSIFRFQIRNVFEPEKMLANDSGKTILNPKFKDELIPSESADFDITAEKNLPMPGDFGMEPKLSEHDWDLLEAIEIALEAAGFEPHPLDRETEPTVDLEEPPKEEPETEEESKELARSESDVLRLTAEEWRSLMLRNAVSAGLVTAVATLAATVLTDSCGVSDAAFAGKMKRAIEPTVSFGENVPAIWQTGGINAYPFYFFRAKGKWLAEMIAMFGFASWETVRNTIPKSEVPERNIRILPPLELHPDREMPRSTVITIPGGREAVEAILGENAKAGLRNCGAFFKKKASDFAKTAVFGAILLNKMAERHPKKTQPKGAKDKQPR